MSVLSTITILGSTGSIGVSTLQVVALHPERYRVFALTANNNIEKIFEQCLEFRPQYAVMANAEAATKLRERLHARAVADIEVLSGVSGLEQVASDESVDYVMAAIVGAAGLLPTFAAAKSGKRILLANKESLVMSGQLLIDAVSSHDAALLPIDSEHNAIWQCMPFNKHNAHAYKADLKQEGVEKILLTASGGPFRNTALADLDAVTPEQACAHPNWSMGRKISVDSATMMNKGLELIEACRLFNTSADNVQVVLHPQSVIHSMVAYVDGSVLAQLGNPDMRTPIAHALAWPDRINAGVEPLDIFVVAELNFQKPDTGRFPCLQLAYEAARSGGTAATILNAANEVAVAAFLAQDIRFTDIPRVVSAALEELSVTDAQTLEDVLQADAGSRQFAADYICRIK